jgi:anti-anti-sigma factor
VPHTVRRSPQSGIPFGLAIHPERDCVRVAPTGELDIATAGDLDAKLRELHDAGFVRIVLDLRELEFIGSAGVRLLVVHNDLARRDGREFTLIAGPPAVQRVIELCGLLEQLTFSS